MAPEIFNKQRIGWKKAAKQGFVQAQYSLAMAYRSKIGAEQNKQQAIYWLQQAAKNGNSNAQYVLANEYLRGDIVKQNYTLATEWMQKAADNGYGAAEKSFFSAAFCSEVSAALE